jgi:SAM-dependent methyltransferase
MTMIRQRPANAAPVVQASAMQLPFHDAAFAAGLAILTIHHWPGRTNGLVELARVVRQRLVILTYDPAGASFWLVRDYFPGIADIDAQKMPSLHEFRRVLGPIDVHPVPIPHDCTDGLLGAYWRRPSAYLDSGVRGAISAFAMIPNVDSGLVQLRADLADGTWERRYGHLLRLDEIDLGYRLIVADLG